MSAEVLTNRRAWWGKYELEQGALGHWRIGPLSLWLRRTALDWRYGFERSDDILESSLEIHVPVDDRASAATRPDEAGRFGCTSTDPDIELRPLLADRPVVVRPAVPFFIPPGQKVELFVSTPLWVSLHSGKMDLTELPCVRPSDTWFGTNTRGELSYATKTHLGRHLENLPQRPHRAVTCLTVENAASEMLTIKRLSLPVPQLSLFATPAGSLWTQHVSLKKEEGGGLAQVTLSKGAPGRGGGGMLVSPPRAELGRSFGSLVFGGLFDSGY
ncbi:MAG: hypothetical protein ACI9F9_002335 [Candidatus Paceibacteria bacterium]|jgi:hypothetical protein